MDFKTYGQILMIVIGLLGGWGVYTAAKQVLTGDANWHVTLDTVIVNALVGVAIWLVLVDGH